MARIDALERVVSRSRPQKRMQLDDIAGGNAAAPVGQKRIFRVEQTGGLVGALDVTTNPVEVPGLVSVEGALGDAGEASSPFRRL